MATYGVVDGANAQWFLGLAILSIGVFLAVLASQVAIAEDERAAAQERVCCDELTWVIPDGFADDIVESARESVLADSPSPRFLLLKDSVATLPKSERPMTLDILQEFVAPEMFIVDEHPMDAVVRLEASLDVNPSFFAKLGVKREVSLLDNNYPTLKYTVYLRGKDGKQVTLRPPSDGRNIYYVSPKGPGTKSYSVPCDVRLGLGFAEILAKQVSSGERPEGRYRIPLQVKFEIAPSNHRQPGPLEPGDDNISAEKASPEALEQMFWQYLATSKHPGRDSENFKWHARNVRAWSVAPGRAFSSFQLWFDLKADGTLGYDRKEMTNWCVYVPEGKMEFRDVVTSVPLVRCSWTDHAKAKRVLPLLSVDTLRTAPAR